MSGIFPEAIEISLPEDIHIQKALYMLGYACLRHKTLLEVGAVSFGGGLSSAVVWIATPYESLQALVVIKKNSLLFILPPKISVPV